MYSARDDARLWAPGFPIRTSPDQSLLSGSPELIAASHVLHRSLAPRHPPCALSSLTTKDHRLSHSKSFSALEDTLLFSCQRPILIALALLASETMMRNFFGNCIWWSAPGLNRQPSACKADALPIELPPQRLPRSNCGSVAHSRLLVGGPRKTRTSDLALIRGAL